MKKSREALIAENRQLRGKLRRLDRIERKFKRGILDNVNMESLTRHLLLDKPKKI